MKSKLIVLTAILASYLLVTAPSAAALGVYQSGTTGIDVSYPNCSVKLPKVSFGVVGVTSGTVFSRNTCLTSEAQNFSRLSLYMNTGWYDQSSYINPSSPKACVSGDANCLAYNYGYNAALDAFNYANNLGVRSSMWWLDAETSNSWSTDVNQNINSLQGSYDALKLSGIPSVGVYSTTYQWQQITGGWQNNWPNWGATTWTTSKQAAKYCTGHQFTGGPTYLIQYVGRSLDQDYAC